MFKIFDICETASGSIERDQAETEIDIEEGEATGMFFCLLGNDIVFLFMFV